MTRRAGVVGAHSLDHFSLVVPDLDEAATFYQHFGLDMKPAGNELEMYTTGNPHRWARYHAGPSKVLDYLSFGVYEDDLPEFRKRLAERNVAIAAAPPHALDESGIWFRDDDGNLIELRVAEKSSPNAKATASNPSVPAGVAAMQMADAGHVRGWGFGRHVLGSNYFHYIRDPWGSYCEYSHDIDYVPANGNWEARRVSPENGFYLWGPVPPDDFAFNYESPAASLSKDLLSSPP
jgi:catechol 2,3-dioxygenase-like lactoylglutathione lyase family enzyme